MGYLTCGREFHRDFGGPRPKIVCLCGSTRFYDAFQQANYDETMAGRIVLSVGFYPHAKAAHGHGEGVGHDSDEKVALDELHKRKIDLADEVLVLNVGGYIGDSTRSEIAYAEALGKPIRWLESGQPAEPATDDKGRWTQEELDAAKASAAARYQRLKPLLDVPEVANRSTSGHMVPLAPGSVVMTSQQPAPNVVRDEIYAAIKAEIRSRPGYSHGAA